jgi:hypothetical protein
MTPARALLLFLLLVTGWMTARLDVLNRDIIRFRAAVAAARAATERPLPTAPSPIAAHAPDPSRPGTPDAMPSAPAMVSAEVRPRHGRPATAFPALTTRRSALTASSPAPPSLPASFAAAPSPGSTAPPATPLPAPTAEQAAFQQAERGYEALARRDRRSAATAFAEALALAPDALPQRTAWQTEQARLNDRWRLAAFGFWRAGSPSPFDPAASGRALGGSQSALLATYRPDPLGPRPVSVVGRVITANRRAPLLPRVGTTQATLGLSWEPLPETPGALVVERWIKVGDGARDAWAARGWIGQGSGYGPVAGENSWTHWSVYTEAAVVGARRRDLFGAAEAHLGRGMALGDESRLTAVASLWAMVQHDDRDVSRLEAGPGLWWTGSAGGVPIDVRVAYRRRIAGNAVGGNGLTATLGISF